MSEWALTVKSVAEPFPGRRWFTIKEASEILGIPGSRLYKLARSRQIDFLTLPGGYLRIARQTLGLPDTQSEPQRSPTNRLIYFALSPDWRVKIGISSDVPKRIASLISGGGVPLQLLGTIVGDYRAERALHTQFADYRLLGEWFDCRDELRRYLADLFGEIPNSGFKPEPLTLHRIDPL